MQKMFKSFLGVIILLIIIGLVACTKDKKSQSQTVTLSGKYADSGYKLDMYKSKGASVTLSATQAKLTCPENYVALSINGFPSFDEGLSQATCTKEGGCKVLTMLLIKPDSFKTRNLSVAQGRLTDIAANSDDILGVMCVKKDQVNDWD